MENAGAALLSLAGDVYEREKFDTAHVNELFDVNALGGLGCLPPIAEQVVESFMECEGCSLRVLNSKKSRKTIFPTDLRGGSLHWYKK